VPRFLVIGKILRDGKEYVPGDSIDMSREQAKQYYLKRNYCIEITDRKLLQEVWDEQEARRREEREMRLLSSADMLGVKREVVKRGLLD